MVSGVEHRDKTRNGAGYAPNSEMCQALPVVDAFMTCAILSRAVQGPYLSMASTVEDGEVGLHALIQCSSPCWVSSTRTQKKGCT